MYRRWWIFIAVLNGDEEAKDDEDEGDRGQRLFPHTRLLLMSSLLKRLDRKAGQRRLWLVAL